MEPRDEFGGEPSERPTADSRDLDVAAGRADDGGDQQWVRLLLGALAPITAGLALARADDPQAYRPGTILLALIIFVAVFIGFRPGVVATVFSCVTVWVLSERSPSGLSGTAELISMTLFVLAAAGVLVLVGRIEDARRVEHRQRVISDALLDATPVGIGLFNADMTFERVNRHLAELNGVAAADHIGRRPRDLNAVAAVSFEPLLAEVRATGREIDERQLSLEEPEFGVERHWTASFQPIHGGAGQLLGIGATVQDTTGDVIARRQSALLLSLARDLAEVVDRDQLVVAVTGFLASAFSARSGLAFVDVGSNSLQASEPMSGYPPDAIDSWLANTLPLDGHVPMTDAVRTRTTVTIESAEEFDQRYPATAELRSTRGDEACICVPVTEPAKDGVVAVFFVAWPHRRAATDTSLTLCETVSSLVGLAWNRIRLSEQINEDRFRSALDSMLDQVAIATAIRSDDGAIADFRIEFTNAASVDGAGRTGGAMEGKAMSELYPRWRDSGMFDMFADVVETGTPVLLDRFGYQDRTGDGDEISGFWNLQVVKFGDGYIAASRDVTPLVQLEQTRRVAEAQAERERVAVELLQQAALPIEVPRVEGVTIGAMYRPAVELQPIGGDWYDAFVLRDGRLGLLIADVSGHGPESAAFMVQIRNYFRAIAVQGDEPDVVLGAVNQIVCDFSSSTPAFATCCYCVLDPTSGEVAWAAAGHPPPIIADRRGVRLAEQRPGLPLAVSSGATYRTQRTVLEAGSRVVLYTDGLFERRGETIDDGLERLSVGVASLSHLGATDAATALGGLVESPFDDMAALVVDLDPSDRA